MKYSNESLAAKLSRAPDYVETAKAVIQEMYRQVGSAAIEDDIMQRGLIVRHLMLPGELDNTLGVLDWFSETFPKGDVLFSLMSQYVPMGKAKKLPPYDRKITEEEYDAAISYLDFLGIESAKGKSVNVDVEAAMEALGEATGRVVREDITNRIFERFCVGK